MKVLLVSTSSGSRGGGELCLLYLGRALVTRGHEVTLWSSTHPRMDELAQQFAAIGAVVRAEYANSYDRRGRSIASWLDRATSRRVAKQWRALAPDVIHVNKQNLEDGIDLLRAARSTGIACLAMIHITQTARYLRARFSGVRDWVSRRALQTFPGLLVTNPESRCRDLLDFIGETPRVRMVPNGVPVLDLAERDRLRPEKRRELGVGANERLFVAVGRMVPQKRPLAFLELAARIHRELPEARFLWVGDGELTAEWDAWIERENMRTVVRRLPWQSAVPPFLAAADVFVHVAKFEGLAFAILEALAAGLPCAITPNLLREMPFLNAGNSIAIEDDDAWLQPLKDSTRLAEIGSAAHALATAQFSFARMAENYETLYRESMEGAR